jgi:hypothetical protein
MGKFAMPILCDRAQRRGVSQLDYVLREGNIPKNLIRFAIETNATVMGSWADPHAVRGAM